MLEIAPVVFIHDCRRAPMSHRSLLTAKKRALVNKGNGGVMRDRVTVASFNKNKKVTFFCSKHS
jgi:hypothetical protein